MFRVTIQDQYALPRRYDTNQVGLIKTVRRFISNLFERAMDDRGRRLGRRCNSTAGNMMPPEQLHGQPLEVVS